MSRERSTTDKSDRALFLEKLKSKRPSMFSQRQSKYKEDDDIPLTIPTIAVDVTKKDAAFVTPSKKEVNKVDSYATPDVRNFDDSINTVNSRNSELIDRFNALLSPQPASVILPSVSKRDESLRRRIQDSSEILEKQRLSRQLQESRRKKSIEEKIEEKIIPTPEEEDPAFVALSDNQRALVEYAWSKGSKDEILGNVGKQDILRSDLLRLKGKTWLNDEIINAYMILLSERNIRDMEGGTTGRVHFFNSYFYQKLAGDNGDQYDYSSVRRWTRRPNKIGYSLLECHKVCTLNSFLVV